TIGRWYDLDVRVPDARLARRLVTAEFSRQSASEMIAALAVAMDATVEREGRAITLRPRGNRRERAPFWLRRRCASLDHRVRRLRGARRARRSRCRVFFACRRMRRANRRS